MFGSIQRVSHYCLAHLLVLLPVAVEGQFQGGRRVADHTKASWSGGLDRGPQRPERGLVLRISEQALRPNSSQAIGGRVDRITDVRRTVLETDVKGKCRTTGDVTIDVRPGQDGGHLVLHFRGISYSETKGENGPAVIHSSAVTRFQCQKQVHFDLERGFQAEPSSIQADTQLTTKAVESNRRGFLGRIVKNVARRRVDDSHPLALEETRRAMERDICGGFDQAVDARLAELNARLPRAKLMAAMLGSSFGSGYCVRSDHDTVEVCFGEMTHDLPTRCVSTPVEVCFHQSLVQPHMRAGLYAYAALEHVLERLPFADQLRAWGWKDEWLRAGEVDCADGWFIVGLPYNPTAATPSAASGPNPSDPPNEPLDLKLAATPARD